MNKILRNSLVAVFALMANLSFADTTVTFTAGTDNGKYTGSGNPASGAETITKDGVTISTTKGAFAAINYNTQAGEYRIYKSETFTASTTSGNIKKIVFTCTATGTEKQGPGCFTGTGYTFEADGYIGTWTGSAASVTLNATSNQVRATKIEVTIGNGDSPVDPDPTPDPDPKPEVKTCANIAEFKALASGTTAILTLTNAEVVYKNEYKTNSGATNTEYYVRDASGAIQFFNTGLNLASGQLLNGTVEVKYSPYNEMPEAAKSANTSEDNLEIDDADDIQPTVISVEDLANSDKYLCDWVIVKNAEMLKEVTTNTDGTKTYTNYYMTSGDAKVMVYDKFKKGITFSETGTYNIQGIAVKASLSGKIITELAPIAAPVATGINNITATEATTNAPIYNLAGQKVSKAFKGIVIQNGKKFVK